MNKLTEDEQKQLLDIVEHFEKEDKPTRERQIRTWRMLKMFWEGFSQIYYSEVAHDWRVPDDNTQSNDQSYYDKPVNIFRAYLESIIAALSATIPAIKCFPDDADNALDLSTAKASDKIAELIYRHNDVILIWLHSLYIFCTEGMVACYSYSKEDESYGMYKEDAYEEEQQFVYTPSCPECGNELGQSDSAPHTEMMDCPQCEQSVMPQDTEVSEIDMKLVGTTKHPKSRQCMEVYGGTYVQIPNYAKKQEDCPYLQFSYETHFTNARARFSGIREKINGSKTRGQEEYERYGRTSNQYQGSETENNVTVRECWLRPSAFEYLDEQKDVDNFKKMFPKGVKVSRVDDNFAEAIGDELDKHWTLTHNPLADFIHHDPLGLSLVSTQEITNDLLSLVLQTIEHGIPQTFADPNVLSFSKYQQQEVSPGSIFPATARSGRALGDGFYDVKTATLSPEVLPFSQQVQNLAQLVSGALPSLFGGQIEGSKTASEYNMSRTQALQRQQNTYRIFTVWWKQIFGKVIPAYIKDMKEDEKFVKQDEAGNFMNVFIRKADVEGKIGNIELDPSENLPMTWMQRKDSIMKIIELNNPELLQMLFAPENIEEIKEAIGMTNVFIPGEDDSQKQREEIVQLLASEPIEGEFNEMAAMESAANGIPYQPEQLPSIEVDEIFDNHQIEFTICRNWMVSPVGRDAKITKPKGYMNVLLHTKGHHLAMMEAQMKQQQAAQMQQPQEGQKNGTKPPAKPTPSA